MQLSELRTQLSGFTQMEEVIATLYYAYELSQTNTLANTILYGPPGYAKSLLAKTFLEVMGHPSPKKHQFSAGTSIQQLIGMTKLGPLQEGKIEINTDSSFINHEVAIFEEMYNAPKHVLAVLIDILMSGEYCVEGNLCYKSKCKFIIACTNIEPSTWAQGDEEKVDVYNAFNERFPFQQRVAWKDHSMISYQQLIETVLHTQSDEFCAMMAVAHEKGKTISPRTAIIACQAYTKLGLESIRSLKGVDQDLMFEFEKIDAEKQNNRHRIEAQNRARQIGKSKKVTIQDLKSCLDALNRHHEFDKEFQPDIALVKRLYDQEVAKLVAGALGTTADIEEA